MTGSAPSAAEAAEAIVTPGETNFISDLHVATFFADPTRCLATVPLRPDTAAWDGTAAASVALTLVDVAASDPALAGTLPDWIVTQDLAVHACGPVREGPLVCDSRLVRLGKRSVVVASELYDGRGTTDLAELRDALDADRSGTGADGGPTLAFRSLLTFARIPGTAAHGVDDYDPNTWLGTVRRRDTETVPPGTLRSRMGIEVLDAERGIVELDRTPYVANSVGTINGGAQAILAEAAAEALRPGLVAADLAMRYLSQVRVGPARTRARVSRDGADHSVVTVEIVDAGHDDQLLALATVTLQASRT